MPNPGADNVNRLAHERAATLRKGEDSFLKLLDDIDHNLDRLAAAKPVKNKFLGVIDAHYDSIRWHPGEREACLFKLFATGNPW